MSISLPGDVSLLAPELALALWGCGILMLDLVLPGAMSRRPLMWLSLLGLAVVAGLSLSLLTRPLPTTSFAGFLVVDQFSIYFKLIFLISAALVVLASDTFTERLREYEAEFYGLLLLCTTGLMLMATTGELMSLYLSLELSSLSLALLATWAKRDLRSSEAGMKFFILSAMSSAILLYGMALLYGLTGSTSLREIARLLVAGGSTAAMLAMSMLVAGFGFKIAAVPFQMWTPDVYEGAPTPVTAFLSTASKAAGFAVILRIFQSALGSIQPEWTTLFAILAIVTMTVGNIMALVQTNLKRLLAYSSIGHVGYMLAGLATGTAFGLSSVIFYLLVYAFTNVGAFAVLIVMSRYAEDENINSYSGLARRAPWLSAAMAFCLLSLAGLPPLAGFFGKLYIFWAVAEHGMYWLVLAGVINSAISLYYYARVIRQMYLVEAPSVALAEPSEEPRVGVGFAPALSLAAAVIGIFVIGPFSGPFIQAAVGAAQGIVP
jgi:NADH-quinone oxidoreductase subunit N